MCMWIMVAIVFNKQRHDEGRRKDAQETADSSVRTDSYLLLTIRRYRPNTG